MVFLTLTVILTKYLLAIGRRWITVLLVVGAVAATAAVTAAHGVPGRPPGPIWPSKRRWPWPPSSASCWSIVAGIGRAGVR